MAEVVNAVHEAELTRARGPWRTVEQVELAAVEWVWWGDNQRLNSQLDYRTLIEAETESYRDSESLWNAIASLQKTEERNQRRFTSLSIQASGLPAW